MADGIRQGRCEVCDNEPRVLLRIESGQWICRSCHSAIKSPKSAEPQLPARATPQQLAEARRCCLIVDEDVTGHEITILFARHESIKQYVDHAFEAFTGKRPRQCDIPHEVINGFVADLMQVHGLGHAICSIQQNRSNSPGDCANDAEVDDADEDVIAYTPRQGPIPEDATFRAAAKLMRAEWSQYLPGAGLRYWLLGD